MRRRRCVFLLVLLLSRCSPVMFFGETPVLSVETHEKASSLRPLIDHDANLCLDRPEILERYEKKCAALDLEAFGVCAGLEGCGAVVCLPEVDFFFEASFEESEGLRLAAKRGDVASLRRELLKGADVDGRDERHMTPLMLAASLEAALELLNFGASALVTDRRGQKASDVAKQGSALVDLLARAERRETIARDRCSASSPRELDYLVREAIASDARAKKKAAAVASQLRAGIDGPLCFFEQKDTSAGLVLSSSSSDKQNFIRSEDFRLPCDGNSSYLETRADVYETGRRCTRYVFQESKIADAVDLETLPSFAARRVTDARNDGYAIVILDKSSRRCENRLHDLANSTAKLNGITRTVALLT